MRGYFGIGAEGISKPINMGALVRTAHAFGASFIFSVGAKGGVSQMRISDTSRADRHVPYYCWRSTEQMQLPHGSVMVGVELCPEGEDLRGFRHPPLAVYVLGPESGSLSGPMQERCSHVVKIPTRYCINLSLAGALVMYDRVLKLDHRARTGALPSG